MNWIPIRDRKPPESGYYYWKGKSGYGGWSWFNAETGEFEFNHTVPVNKVGEDYLQWLEE